MLARPVQKTEPLKGPGYIVRYSSSASAALVPGQHRVHAEQPV